MVGLTETEIKGTLAAFEELRCEGRDLYFASSKVPAISINLRLEEPHQLVYLARLAALLGHDERHFGHADLWVTTWGVWNPKIEAVGFKTLEQFRRSFGENRSLEAAPGHYFRQDEFTESVCCLLQPMIVGWDAYYVPHWAGGSLDHFVTVSHDSFIDIETRTQEMHDRALEVLSSHEWIKPLLRADS
jgi:hypothetical protein